MPFTIDMLTPETCLSELTPEELQNLADSMRSEILETVARQGGHLASNLGDLELILALHTVFDFNKDRLFFDTGHQCYAHKFLTGRLKLFRHLREADGCCGFPLRTESPFDVFGTGHSGTAISAALGFAVARDRKGDNSKVIALVGDGALGCGSSLEGLNNIAVTTKDFLLILNDNKMSIAPNVGAISRFLNHVISARSYNVLKSSTTMLVNWIPLIGRHLKNFASRVESAAKALLIHRTMFSDLGLRYLGPVDGNDLEAMVYILRRIHDLHGPIILHVFTRKGKGYKPAEDEPSRFHGTVPFDIKTARPLKPSPPLTFSKAFGNALTELRRTDERIIAITAGMPDGTGLKAFATLYPKSFFDTGIAEGHAAAFAAGLAAAGMKPVFAVYASFAQRAFDFIFHDACLQNLPVVFCLDRAGVVADGATHHGIQDIAFLRALPNISIMQPSDADELTLMLADALKYDSPVVIRYPFSDASPLCQKHAPLIRGRAETVRDGNSPVAIWAVGRELETALAAADILAAQGINPAVVNTRFLIPFDMPLMADQIQKGFKVFILENHLSEGGFASIARDALPSLNPDITGIGWPRTVLGWGNVNALRKKHGLSPDAVAARIADSFKRDCNT